MLRTLQVPTATITEVKQSPVSIFGKARETNTGVYVFNRGYVAGVMLTREQYEGLVYAAEDLQDRLVDARAAQRINDPAPAKTYHDAHVRGERAAVVTDIDPHDGWE
jgi:hypothetical protein